ncbi:MAG: glycoside hydrolase family 127 protein [Mogibacterium sp.]|nr:glycoside hydrolase family 127 protein [Mogibacterium sp.]
MKNTITHPELEAIRLIPGTPFYDRQQEMNEFLLAWDTDSLLYNFRKAAGLSTGDAEPMTGWDADECKLKGHTTGHYLSGVSLAYAATGDERFAHKAEAIVKGLKECQAAFASSGKTAPGFVSAYDEEQFDLLEVYTKYPEIWAPYYTLDKIMSGLIDAYELAGIKEALDVLLPLGDWVYRRLSRLPDDQRTRMWSMYIAGEYGAMISTMVRLYRISGSEDHLKAAKLFENDKLFGQMADGRDELDTMHANQHIPQIMGALELFAETGESRYMDIAANFEQIVTEHHCYSFGGTGEHELFHAADDECSWLTDSSAESCASYNMLRLTGRLHEFSGSAGLMDYYERTLFNHILMSCSHAPDGGTTYFLPTAPGSTKHYETEENSCCHGTGMESRYRYMTDIYSFDGDEEGGMLRIELPVSSVLRGSESVTVSFTDDGIITVRADEDMKRRLAVRIPSWADAEDAGSYRVIPDRLRQGDAVTIDLGMNTRKVRIDSDPEYACLAWGPYLLAAVSEDKEFIKAPGADKLTHTDDSGEFVCTCPDCSIRFRPMYRIDGEAYHIYMKN